MNNALYILYNYPIATSIWNITRDFVKILLSKHIRIDIRTVLLDIDYIKDEPRYKNIGVLINILLIVVINVIYSLLYKEDKLIN